MRAKAGGLKDLYIFAIIDNNSSFCVYFGYLMINCHDKLSIRS
jgi:hypothetical protein